MGNNIRSSSRPKALALSIPMPPLADAMDAVHLSVDRFCLLAGVTNIVENALGTVRQVTRNVKRWRHAEMALRWTAAGLLEAQKTFRRLKAYRQLPILRNALQEHLRKAQADSAIETIMKAA